MLRVFAKIIGLLLAFSLLTSCGDVSRPSQPGQKELVLINQVLKNWREGYQSEDLDRYMSTFWEDGFFTSQTWGLMLIQLMMLYLMISGTKEMPRGAFLLGTKTLRLNCLNRLRYN